jgi:hypothetical protein
MISGDDREWRAVRQDRVLGVEVSGEQKDAVLSSNLGHPTLGGLFPSAVIFPSSAAEKRAALDQGVTSLKLLGPM